MGGWQEQVPGSHVHLLPMLLLGVSGDREGPELRAGPSPWMQGLLPLSQAMSAFVTVSACPKKRGIVGVW